MLKRRIILPDAGADFFTRTDQFTDIMREVVRYNCGPNAVNGYRNLLNFTVEADTHQGDSLTVNWRHLKASEQVSLLAEAGGADWDVVWYDGALIFIVYYPRMGLDRRIDNTEDIPPTVFSPERGNMRTPTVDRDRIEEITAVYVAGDGIGAARTIEERLSLYDAQYDSPWNRVEDFIQGTQDINVAMLQATGDAHLMDNKAKLIFDFQAVPTEGCLYGRDWNVGDLVTAYYLGGNYDIQVAEVHITVSPAQGEEIDPTFLYLPEPLT